MSERQKHGFDFQEQYINSNNLTPDENYTGEWDAYTKKQFSSSDKNKKKER